MRNPNVLVGGVVAATLLAAGCRDSLTPAPDAPAFSHASGTADLTIATVTTGESIPAGYTFSASGPAGSVGDEPIGANDARTFSEIVPGTYEVTLGSVPLNCTLSGDNPRTVTLPDAGTATATFEVSCTATAGGVSVSGVGAFGPGDATPGSDYVAFEFEASDAPGGRMVVTDYRVVRDDGTPASMTVDPETDPETGITSFSEPSTACVNFGGIGRLDRGGGSGTWTFFVHVCDNASPGVGADTFHVTMPDRPYSTGGTLSEGDIVKSTSTSPPPPPPPSGTGNLTITTATTGDDIPHDYTLGFSGPTGSGAITFGANETRTFPEIAPGEHSLTLGDVPANCTVSGENPRTINVPDGGSTSTTFDVGCTGTPTSPPVAKFTFNCSELTCSFDASGSTAQATATYRWTWGDGTSDGSGKTATHTYRAAGSYDVTLTVTDDGGSSTKTQAVTVDAPTNQKPTVNAGPDEKVLLGLLYSMSWSFSDPDNGPWSYRIDWGDGTSTTGTKSSPGTFSKSHTYLLIGQFTIRVTVVDSRGASASDTKTLTVFTKLLGL